MTGRLATTEYFSRVPLLTTMRVGFRGEVRRPLWTSVESPHAPHLRLRPGWVPGPFIKAARSRRRSGRPASGIGVQIPPPLLRSCLLTDLRPLGCSECWSDSAEQLDVATGAGRLSKPPVGGEKGRFQRFGERDVGGVVRRVVVPKLPNPTHEGLVPGTGQWEGRQVRERLTRAFPVKPTGSGGTPPHRADLEIDELRCNKALAGEAPSCPPAVGAIIAKCRSDDRRVDDHHRVSRSARTACADSWRGTFPLARSLARWSTSSSVGREASSVRRARRYSCNDWPASTARRRSTRWTSSGTFLI